VDSASGNAKEMTLALHRAGPADAPALAHIHHQVWTETYGAIAPVEAIAALTEAHRLTGWSTLLRSDGPTTLVALQGETPVGLVSFGAPTDSVFGNRGEVRHLYLLPSHRGRGHGLRLLTVALMGLRDAGFPGAALAVIEQNTRARSFYQRAGGEELLSFTDKGPLWRSRNRMVAWTF
jgi:ribosomal protein S18 acetylase RimI-like enzyme